MAIELNTWIPLAASYITIGLALPYVFRFFTFIIYSRFRKGVLEGIWHSYNFSTQDDKIIFRHEQWKIKRDWQNRLTIKTRDPNNSMLEYKGTISEERDGDYLLFLLRGIRVKRVVQMRFYGIVPSGQDMAFGLAMGVNFDHDHKPHCVVRIMSRKELTSEEATKLIQSKTFTSEYGILGIKEYPVSKEKMVVEPVAEIC